MVKKPLFLWLMLSVWLQKLQQSLSALMHTRGHFRKGKMPTLSS